MKNLRLFCAAGVIAAASAQRPISPKPSIVEYPSPLVREEQQVKVGDAMETWRLQWKARPKPLCDSADDALKCPCIGFAYGETGDLSLIRLRDGMEIDRLRLTAFFGEDSGAVLPRWPVDADHDTDLAQQPNFAATVHRRRVVQVMNFADYDHDGAATECYFETQPLACGHWLGMVVGVSKSNPKLHVFGTAVHPDKPLYLEKHEFEALRDASAPLDIVDWRCDDHGADTEVRLHLFWNPKGIDGTRSEFNCPENLKDQRVLSTKPL